MRRFPLVIVVLLSAQAGVVFGSSPPAEEMVKSRPVVIQGFQFIASTESVWTVANPPYGKQPIEVQLFITNLVGRDRVFPLFDTFALRIKDATGHELTVGGGRDHTLLCRPVMIRAGDTYCLSRSAALAWNQSDNGKTKDFTYEDGTGSWNIWRGLSTGSYSLSFSIACTGLDSQTQFLSKVQHFDWSHYLVWTGTGATHEVHFTIVDPPAE